jgi:CheY-like chemotaxis protein
MSAIIANERKKILIVDNDPDWVEIISSALRKGNLFYIESVENRKAAIQMLQKNKFDLVFVNFLLRESFSGPWLADFTMILDEISNQNGRAIMITGVNSDAHDIMNKIFEIRQKYQEILLVLPKGDIATYEIRDAALDALGVKMSNLVDRNAHQTNPIEAIDETSTGNFSLNLEPSSKITDQNNVVENILMVLRNNLSTREFFRLHEDKIQMLIESREDRKIYSSVSLWNALWLEESGMPNLPLMKVLAEQEFSGEMYTDYRDHVSHSIWMYFLGLYLYNQNEPIRNAIRTKLSEDVFFKAWKIASIFHDIGYAGDKGIDKEDNYLQPLLEDLNSFIRFPIGGYLKSRRIECSEADEAAIAHTIGFFTPKILNLDDLEKVPVPGKDENLLNFIEGLVIPTQLAQINQKTPLQNYYSLGKTVKPKNRERFRDHGILSALILLYQFYYFDYYLKGLKNASLPARLGRETRSAIEKMMSEPITLLYEEPVKQAAAAMALHNVNVDIWDIEKAKDAPNYLSLSDYKITLQDTPLAFLLAFTDVLQCWDRPKRRYVDNPNELSLRNQDIRIRCDGNLIIWSIRTDPATGDKLIKPAQEIQIMSKYLSITRDKNLSILIRQEDWTE